MVEDFHKLWEELNSSEEDAIFTYDESVYGEEEELEEDLLLEMANLVGRRVKTDSITFFSIFFS